MSRIGRRGGPTGNRCRRRRTIEWSRRFDVQMEMCQYVASMGNNGDFGATKDAQLRREQQKSRRETMQRRRGDEEIEGPF